jgi:hypothetical protein
MPSWARRPPKLFYLGLGGSVVSGILYHIIDPPRIAILGVEAVLLAVVMVLAIPRSPQTPNLNPISQLIDAHAV